jgi:hypothetical protein
MARYLVAKGWSIWTETDAKLNELREIEHSAYDQTRHKGTQAAVKAAYVAVLQADDAATTRTIPLRNAG